MFTSKNFNSWLFFLAFISCWVVLGFVVGKVGRLSDAPGSPLREDKGVRTEIAANHNATGKNDARQKLQRVYSSQIGVQEATGKNDGPEVEKYLRYSGLPKGYSYCAAFTCWAMRQAEIHNPRNGWAPALFPAKQVIWSQTRGGATPQTGDVFGIYFSELKRIGHCGFVDAWDGRWLITVEANTSNAGAVTEADDPSHPIRAGPGEGVYRKKRMIKTIYKVANWIDH